MVRLKFGGIENKKLPKDFFDRLIKNIGKYGVRVRDSLDKRRGFRFAEDEKEFVFIRVVKDIKERKPYYDDKKAKETEIYNLWDDLLNLYIFKETLEFICEITAKTSFEDIANMLKEAWDLIKYPEEESLKIKSIDKFPQKLLKEFYKEAKEITGIEFSKVGQMPPNPTPTLRELKGVLEDFKRNVDSAGFRTSGRKGSKKNIKKSKVINKALVSVSRIKEIKGYDKENRYFYVNQSGTLSISLPKKEEKAKDKMKNILNRFRKFVFE